MQARLLLFTSTSYTVPAARILAIPAEDRVLAINAEDRVLAIKSEDRVLAVPADS